MQHNIKQFNTYWYHEAFRLLMNDETMQEVSITNAKKVVNFALKMIEAYETEVQSGDYDIKKV